MDEISLYVVPPLGGEFRKPDEMPPEGGTTYGNQEEKT